MGRWRWFWLVAAIAAFVGVAARWASPPPPPLAESTLIGRCGICVFTPSPVPSAPSPSPPTPTPTLPAYCVGDVATITDDVNLRSGPALESPSVAVLREGTFVVVTGPRAEAGALDYWPVLAERTGEAGFVRADFLAGPPCLHATATPPATATPAGSPTPLVCWEPPAVVTKDEADMRAEPSDDGALIARFPRGTMLMVIGPPVAGDGALWWPVYDLGAGGAQMRRGYIREDSVSWFMGCQPGY